MLKELNPLHLSEKPKCLASSPTNNYDAYSTETDTPKNEKVAGLSSTGKDANVFKFPNYDSSGDGSSSQSNSKRNSLQNEERPVICYEGMPMSHLMLCHFGADLH